MNESPLIIVHHSNACSILSSMRVHMNTHCLTQAYLSLVVNFVGATSVKWNLKTGLEKD